MTCDLKDVVPNNLAKIIIIVSVTLGMVESAAWFVLSLISICFFRGYIRPSKSSEYFQSDVGRTIYDFYLNRGFEATLKNTMTDEYPLVITATPFFAFMIVYLCLSLCLFLNSSFLLWATLSKFNRLYKENVGIWCILTGIISFIDIILMILFAINYAHIKQFQDSHNEGRSPTDAIVRTATVVVMTLSIRGYVLWIINVVFAVLMGCFTYRYYKEDPLLHSHMSSDSYSTSTSSRLANNGDYNSNLIGETYPSSFYSGLRAKLSHSPTAKFIRALNERVVKKCNDNTTPSSSSIQTKNPEQTVYDNVESYIPPPFIPRPDYSPPLSPRTRQLIRQRNNMLQKDFSFNKI